LHISNQYGLPREYVVRSGVAHKRARGSDVERWAKEHAAMRQGLESIRSTRHRRRRETITRQVSVVVASLVLLLAYVALTGSL
jgi:hypothetical protein